MFSDLRAKNCSTGDVLYDEQTRAKSKEDVLNVLSQIATRFRARAGESLATVEAALDAAPRGDDGIVGGAEGL